jgi:hypothetical protein
MAEVEMEYHNEIISSEALERKEDHPTGSLVLDMAATDEMFVAGFHMPSPEPL